MRATRFQPTLPARGATGAPLHEEEIWQAFQPTLPARGATCCQSPANSYNAHFNPRSPHGERLVPLWFLTSVTDFNPRSPHGERQNNLLLHAIAINFNPRSPHGERLLVVLHHFSKRIISTHAPRTGSDVSDFSEHLNAWNFNPRSPHGERQIFVATFGAINKFQPTLPARGATKQSTAPRYRYQFQPTLPARGATPCSSPSFLQAHYFNPRSPHGERRQRFFRTPQRLEFQPTLPARGATDFRRDLWGNQQISTHAPRTGSDFQSLGLITIAYNFNPRSPHGERRYREGIAPGMWVFQPTLPARGATLKRFQIKPGSRQFQPTLPARGATSAASTSPSACIDFNPRSPHGERRHQAILMLC